MKQTKYIVLLSYGDNSDDFSREVVEVDSHNDFAIEHANAVEKAKRQKYVGHGVGAARFMSPEEIWDEAKEYRVFACFPEYILTEIQTALGK